MNECGAVRDWRVLIDVEGGWGLSETGFAPNAATPRALAWPCSDKATSFARKLESES
jgi:hypothetical protein